MPQDLHSVSRALDIHLNTHVLWLRNASFIINSIDILYDIESNKQVIIYKNKTERQLIHRLQNIFYHSSGSVKFNLGG